MLLIYYKTEVPNFWVLIPDDLRWSWCNMDKDKMHNKCHAFESSWNIPSSGGLWENSLPGQLVLWAKKGRDCFYQGMWYRMQMSLQMKRCLGQGMWEETQNSHAVSPSPSTCSPTKNLPHFLGGPVVKTLRFHYRGHRFDTWLGN